MANIIPKAVKPADVLTAVYQFVEKYGVPVMPPAPETGRIFVGNQNRLSLPKDNQYCIITDIGHYRRGTTVERYFPLSLAEDGDLILSELVMADVQVDFYCGQSDWQSQSDPEWVDLQQSDLAMMRAHAVELAARSSASPAFFKPHGISCYYATDARNLTGVGDADQYVSRWSTTLRLSYTAAIALKDFPGFAEAGLYIENVDVHHPPEREAGTQRSDTECLSRQVIS